MKTEIQKLIEEMNREYHEGRLRKIEQAKQWGKELGGELVGICGHLTGAGAREYPVFKQEDGRHFISFGDKEDLYIFEGDIDEYIDVQEEIKEKCNAEGKKYILIMDLPDDFEERNQQMVRFINPENIFGGKMQTLEKWLE